MFIEKEEETVLYKLTKEFAIFLYLLVHYCSYFCSVLSIKNEESDNE